ncbi:lysine decarboxylase [Fusarium subglutinans]|uniref:Lysine decarboxylase n=1 Tax=Gibberella subglutinans TaxID=42677 RepID=A0A8H5PA65_GIBSU|nr:lysine decarboxylase [Fusarium subglutinans]KAF5592962.1 lysine decarboxylase [Fusarium subglutinans]
MQPNQKLCIAIFGPTASGKTKLGVAIAKTFPSEVISVDSLQCYKAGSIITAKPTAQEIDDVPHHLIDYLEADEEPNEFVALAADKMDEITNRGNLPILVGGSTSLAIPLLHEAFKRQYRFISATLIPRQSTYWKFIQVRASEMLERGLLDELETLRDLQQNLMDDNACFHKGVWKAIGYQEFYPYLEADSPRNARQSSFQRGLALMNANTLQYGFHQLEWIRSVLNPFLHQAGVVCMSLPVTNKTSWMSDVEIPAISMLNDLCYSLRTIKVPTNGTLNSNSNSRVVGLFGGSSPGNDPGHIDAAKKLAFALHQNNYKLVYGGGTTGIMGAIASTLVQLSGQSAVQGIIPVALAKYEERLTKKRADPSKFGSRTVVKDMHTRKRLMIESVIGGAPGSGFVALSGGYGTLEELLETTTWYQLGIHRCGICVFDVCGFYKGLMDWVRQAAQAGFVGTEDATILRVATTAEDVIDCLGSNDHRYSRMGELEWG